jgi:hypothetical protein
MTNHEIVLIGIGEIGGIFARGFLRLGYSVHPVTRETDMQRLAQQVTSPALVVVAVGEQALMPVLSEIPTPWRDRLCLLQNELLPQDWQGIAQPTVISIWFEKKPGMDTKVIIPSPLFGPGSELVCAALDAVRIPCQQLESEADLLRELVIKNLYILTSNIAGLESGGSVDQLWREHRDLAQAVATDVLTLQEALTGQHFDRELMIGRMREAFAGDPDHQCMGRSAPARLTRALEHAKGLGLHLPTLERIAEQTRTGS